MSHQLSKDWMSLDRLSASYRNGIKEFLSFAKENDPENLSTCLCPCKRCLNRNREIYEIVEAHLKTRGINPKYRVWILHGEDPSKQSNVEQVHEENLDNRESGLGIFVDDCYGLHEGVDGGVYGCIGEEDEPIVSEQDMPKKYMEYKRLSEEKLYPSCEGNETTLSAIVELHNLKKQFRVSGACVTMLLAIIKRWLPKGNTLPKTYPKMKAMIKDLGMEVKCIDVCENNCILYRKKYKDATECPQCQAPRYKVKMGKSGEKKSKEANKVLRHFPIIPRLKRLYTIPWIANQMTWHDRAKASKTQMRHPIDSVQWQTIKDRYPDFANEGRNVWLAIATDGFNPRGVLSTAYSCWHVITVAYNLPPSLCMKQDFQMMSLLIPGPKAPSQDIDVFLEPLYDEFNELWEVGVSAYDINQMKPFPLKALLMWGIHDFPAYGNLSGSITHGYKACPSCGDETPSIRLPSSKKIVYLDFRIYLKMNHPFRVGNRFGFKTPEVRPPPQRLSGSTLMSKLSHVKYIPGKIPKGPRRSRVHMNNDDNGDSVEGDTVTEAWYKRSLLYDLPYWPGHKVRHVIDVMHVEKNVSEHILNLLLADTKKTKDTKNARDDMKEMGIYDHWKVINKMTNDSDKPAYVLNKEEKKIFLQTLKDLKVPTGFSSNLSNIVSLEQSSLLVMKSHDHHVIIEYLLPVLLQHAFPRHPDLRRALHQISLFFNLLCSKVILRQDILDAKFMVVEALCVLQNYFPPSFFDISIHLVVHLADEALACGPVHERWMFPFERAMKDCKNIPSNKRFVEGSIAESYLVNESVKYAMEYMPKQHGDIFSKHEVLLDDDDIYGAQGGPILDDKRVILTAEQFTQIRRWVLFRFDDVPLLDEYYSQYREDVEPTTRARGKSRMTEVEIQTQFIGWLYEKLLKDRATDGILWKLVKGPLFDAKTYRKYHVNGYVFSPKSHDDTVRTQDSGVCIKAITTFQSSRKDKNPVDAEILWYGVIKQILEVDYSDFKTVIFYCDWVKMEDKINGCKLCPDSKLVVVNLNNFRKSDHLLNEPAILATEASKVFYSKDLKNPDWWVVIPPSSRLTSQVDQLDEPTGFRSILADQPHLQRLMECVR